MGAQLAFTDMHAIHAAGEVSGGLSQHPRPRGYTPHHQHLGNFRPSPRTQEDRASRLSAGPYSDPALASKGERRVPSTAGSTKTPQWKTQLRAHRKEAARKAAEAYAKKQLKSRAKKKRVAAGDGDSCGGKVDAASTHDHMSSGAEGTRLIQESIQEAEAAACKADDPMVIAAYLAMMSDALSKLSDTFAHTKGASQARGHRRPLSLCWVPAWNSSGATAARIPAVTCSPARAKRFLACSQLLVRHGSVCCTCMRQSASGFSVAAARAARTTQGGMCLQPVLAAHARAHSPPFHPLWLCRRKKTATTSSTRC